MCQATDEHDELLRVLPDLRVLPESVPVDKLVKIQISYSEGPVSEAAE